MNTTGRWTDVGTPQRLAELPTGPCGARPTNLVVMGQEITDSRFAESAFAEFRRRLDVETGLLRDWMAQGRLRSDERRFGFGSRPG